LETKAENNMQIGSFIIVSLLSFWSCYGRELIEDMDTATEMYLYAWPLVMSSLTRKSMFYLPDNIMLPLPVIITLYI
jgi:hypothetical protein